VKIRVSNPAVKEQEENANNPNYSSKRMETQKEKQ
jgi:hypothetical protein